MFCALMRQERARPVLPEVLADGAGPAPGDSWATLIPVKYLGIADGVNVTLGLPFVRTSPDHGTAFDIAGRGTADPASLLAAMRMARKTSVNR